MLKISQKGEYNDVQIYVHVLSNNYTYMNVRAHKIFPIP